MKVIRVKDKKDWSQIKIGQTVIAHYKAGFNLVFRDSFNKLHGVFLPEADELESEDK